MLADVSPGDILLGEAIDPLSRLPQAEWERLKAEIEGKGLRVVALDLPASHAALGGNSSDEFTARMLDAVNRMMLDKGEARATASLKLLYAPATGRPPIFEKF